MSCDPFSLFKCTSPSCACHAGLHGDPTFDTLGAAIVLREAALRDITAERDALVAQLAAFPALDRCSYCNTLHEMEDTCPYCTGFEDGDESAESRVRQSREALEFATQQQLMLTGQLAKRDDIIAALQKDNLGCLDECADMRRQRDMARHELERQRDLMLLWIDRYHDLAESQANARAFLRRLGAGLTLLGGGGLLACLCWDALPSLGRHWNVWAGIAAGLGALLVLRRPVRSVGCCRRCGASTSDRWWHSLCIQCEVDPQELPGETLGHMAPTQGQPTGWGPPGNASG